MTTTSLDLPPVPDRLGFSDEHELARQAARRFLSERCPMTEVRRLAEDPLGHDPALHRETASLGWIGLSASEASGGSALDHLHLGLLLEEMGRVLWPAPFLASVLALATLEELGAAKWAQAVAGGELVATLALEGDDGDVRAVAAPGGFALTGKKAHVLSGGAAGLVLVPAREESGKTSLFAVELPAPGVTVEAQTGVDTTRRSARLVFSDARVPAAQRLAENADALGHARIRAMALSACEMVGAAESVLERTRLYAIERQQFGRAIGSFQAVKHPIVNMMMGIELARSLALSAASLLDQGPTAAEPTARMAKAMAGDVLSECVKKGVQLHGGFGFTWDCDVHFFFKRALASRAAFGDSTEHRKELARQLFEAP